MFICFLTNSDAEDAEDSKKFRVFRIWTLIIPSIQDAKDAKKHVFIKYYRKKPSLVKEC